MSEGKNDSKLDPFSLFDEVTASDIAMGMLDEEEKSLLNEHERIRKLKLKQAYAKPKIRSKVEIAWIEGTIDKEMKEEYPEIEKRVGEILVRFTDMFSTKKANTKQ